VLPQHLIDLDNALYGDGSLRRLDHGDHPQAIFGLPIWPDCTLSRMLL